MAADGEVQGGVVTDRSKRDASFRNLVAILEFEGGKPSEFAITQLLRVVDGEITVEEMRDLVVANAGRKP
jgi:antitoxin VbhA-like protein